MNIIIQKAYQLLDKVHRNHTGYLPYSDLCEYFPGLDVFRCKDNEDDQSQHAVFSMEEEGLFVLWISNFIAARDSGDIRIIFYKFVHVENLTVTPVVRICSCTPTRIELGGHLLDTSSMSLIDDLSRVQIPTEIFLQKVESFNTVTEYLQTRPYMDLVTISVYETNPISVFRIKDSAKFCVVSVSHNDDEQSLSSSTLDECEPDESKSCPVCIANKKKVALVPCGHCVCFSCFDRLSGSTSTNCPVCRSVIATHIRVFV